MSDFIEELKKQGNDAFAKKDFDAAISLYTQAIDKDKDNHILYSNRSAAYLGQGKNTEAIYDAETALLLQPTFTKAHFRKATALQNVGDIRGSRSFRELIVNVRIFVMNSSCLGCYETWKAAKANCERTALVDTQFHASKKQWVSVMRTAPIESMADLTSRFDLLADSRERLSTIAHFWNESSKAERREYFIRFLTIVGGQSGAGVDMSDIQEGNMIPMPMDNYADLPSSRISSWLNFFCSLNSESKTELLAGFWGLLAYHEQNAVVQDLKTFFGAAA